MSIVSNDASLEQSTYSLFTKTALLLDDSDRQFFACHGLTIRQYWTLRHLDEVQGCSMVDLSRVLLTDKSNVTGIIDNLERQNFVQRTPDSRDRRIILITLTPDGRRLRDSLLMEHNARIRDLFHVFDPADLQALFGLLDVFSRQIETTLERNQTSAEI